MMIFGFLPQNLKTKAVAVAFSTAWLRGEVGPGGSCPGAGSPGGVPPGVVPVFTARADALFEVADAVLCADRPVKTLAGWRPDTGGHIGRWLVGVAQPQDERAPAKVEVAVRCGATPRSHCEVTQGPGAGWVGVDADPVPREVGVGGMWVMAGSLTMVPSAESAN
jgi:hypothetical protein